MSFKLRRHVITEKYADRIEAIFGRLECSPKVDPSVMRVCGAEAPLTSNETKET